MGAQQPTQPVLVRPAFVTVSYLIWPFGRAVRWLVPSIAARVRARPRGCWWGRTVAQVHPGVVRGSYARRARRRACERRAAAAGWQVPEEETPAN